MLDAENWQVDVTCPLKPSLHHNALPSVRPGDSAQKNVKPEANRIQICYRKFENEKSVAETHHSKFSKNAEY